MVKIKVKDNGEYRATLTQENLNTISLLLGYSTDQLIESIAKNCDVDDFSIGENLTDLYDLFYQYRTTVNGLNSRA